MGRRAVILAAALLAGAATADDWQARCAAEGGCLLITQQAFEHLVGEIERLRRQLLAPRKGVCI